MRALFSVAASSLLLFAAPAFASEERYEILVSYETEIESEGSSGSSSGRTLYVEDVVSREGSCREHIFDFLDDPEKKRPLVSWEMPTRVRSCDLENPVLLNEDEMEARLEKFLEAVKATREVCGRYYFTWNAFKVECDPNSILETIEHIDLAGVNLREGADYTLAGGVGTGTLSLISRDGDVVTMLATGAINEQFLRDGAAQTKKVVRELNGEEISLEEALKLGEDEQYSGEFTATFVANTRTGDMTRTIVSSTESIDAEGIVETHRRKEITLRKRADNQAAADPS